MIKQSDENLNFNLNDQILKQLINNIPKLPAPRIQLLKIYKNFISLSKITDNNETILQRFLLINQQSLYKQLIAMINLIFYQIDRKATQINFIYNLNQLDKIIQETLQLNYKSIPQGFRFKDFDNNNKKSKLNNSNKMQRQEQQTPGGYEQLQKMQQQLSNQRKADIIFGYLFDRFHILNSYIIKYYQLQNQNSQFLTNAIYQGIYRYVEDNTNSFLNLTDKKIMIKENQQENQKKVIMFQNQNQKPKQQNYGMPSIIQNVMDIVIDSIDDKDVIKKCQQRQNNNQELDRGSIQISKYKVNVFSFVSRAYSIANSIYQKGIPKLLSHSYKKYQQNTIQTSGMIQYKQQQQLKTSELAKVILKSHLRHNIQLQSGLSVHEFQLIQSYLQYLSSNNKKTSNIEILNRKFDQDEKSLIIESISEVIQIIQVQRNNVNIMKLLNKFLTEFCNVEVKNKNNDSAIKSSNIKKGIKTTLSQINASSQLPNLFYFIVILYKQHQNTYCPATRRILIKLCHMIQKKYKQYYKNHQTKQYIHFSLIHALKLLQSHSVKRSQLSLNITNQKPYRQSHLPLKSQKQQYFQQNNILVNKISSSQQAQLHIKHQLHRIFTFQHHNQFTSPPGLQLYKLTHSLNKKNVTILISGFLSQDSDKFYQWMGILEPIYDSEIYALKWESKSVEHMFQYMFNTCRDIILAGAGAGIVGGPYIKAIFILQEIYRKYHQNPFNPAFELANITGVFLADLLISLFDNHFINLIGFSLGTQVIFSAIKQFKKKNKLHMINRIVTMGGVADKKQIINFLNNQVQQKQQKKISISWTNVYCQNDNILRYLLKASKPLVEPVGLGKIEEQNDKQNKQNQLLQQKEKVYQIDNIDASQFIDGHLTYRCNMKTIARLIGLKDQ